MSAPLEDHADLEGADGRRETESRPTLAAVRRLVRELPEDRRLALVLVTVERLSCREAAGQMGVLLGTLTGRLGRARRKPLELVEGGAGAAVRDRGSRAA